MTDDVSTIEGFALVALAALSAASIGTLFRLFQKHIDGRPLLAYEPRTSVPWNAIAPAAILAIALGPLVLNVIGAAAPDRSASLAESEISPAAVWLQAGWMIVVTLTAYAVLTAVFQATTRDMGLPASWAEFRRDVNIGAVAFLAALAPVYAINIVLNLLFQPEQGHPLIEELTERPSGPLLAAAGFAAIIGAPLFEETAFRLVLQGWLERREDASLGYSGDDGRRDEPALLAISEFEGQPENAPDAEAADAALATASACDAADVAPYQPPPAQGLMTGLRHGWTPILLSGTVFALAHLGHGVAPVALLPLAATLGYVYQRTHRVVPSMVCHALFNATSLAMLWLAMASQHS